MGCEDEGPLFCKSSPRKRTLPCVGATFGSASDVGVSRRISTATQATQSNTLGLAAESLSSESFQPGQKTTILSSRRDFGDEPTLRNLAPLFLIALTISGAGCFQCEWIG